MNEIEVVKIKVAEEFSSERLDLFITRMFDIIPSRSFAAKLIENKKVKVEGKFLKASYKIKSEQIIEIDTSFLSDLNKDPLGEKIPLDILFEDEDLIIINKPAGMVVHPGAGVYSGTLVNAILGYTGATLPSLGGPVRAGIVHRLDRDTSGVMVVAKSQLALTHLSKQFAEHAQVRIYHALVYGKLIERTAEIITWHGRDPRNRLKFAVQAEGVGKKAILNYSLLQDFENSSISLVACTLHTGRTHQIRVQMSHIGNGIVGDILYAQVPLVLRKNKELSALILKNAPRQMLHALHLGFKHPRSGKEMSFQAAYPNDFRQLHEILKNRST